MGTRGISVVVGADVEEIIAALNKALASEWLAYVQYYSSSAMVRGILANVAKGEFDGHADDELEHAGLDTARIIQLGGIPLTSPDQWLQQSPVTHIEETDVATLLRQTIAGEQAAITTYQRLVDMTRGKDEVTYQMVSDILADEVEHEEDLQRLLEDLKLGNV